MFSLLPDLAPRDSHALWYTSSRSPLSSAAASHDLHQSFPGASEQQQQQQHASHHHAANQQRRNNAHIVERSPLARLRNDEQNAERRLHNVASFGSGWLKPPGIPKTLHQLREERREQEEHQEAMRREQLAQELAEAEATGGGADADGLEGPSGLGADAVMRDVAGSDAMDEVQLDGTRDLDDDIPEAEDNFMSGSDEESDEEDSEESSEEELEPVGTPAGALRTARLQRDIMTQMMRRTHDQLEDSIAGEEEIDDEDQQEMIEEGDTIGEGDDLGMGVDLDDDIPEADSAGGYEHTDTEEELSSSDDDQGEVSFAAARAPQSVRYRHSLARSDATRNSLAFSELLSADGSSVLGSSPHAPRRV
ncbi:hypothetical protein PFICI_11365 [Pestalotiopsis fici W106-1]|uniref:Apc15p protein-domain-containing protein n=1 Tax=Pestalotiopsis fici (strain W106-1 / CGMCC3.15140) TaxID=1229662 RepID=W3WX86_PESFW|nr:uncharacterized protein PFICI_11365 [Pestalotiopsis fici W106-1]ETS77491.1 hypothetical protein PFICI_11365 [Pestalotiopsis fici W106-1]